MVAEADTATGAGMTDRIASFVSTLEPDDVPPAAIETAEQCFIDTVGVAIAGSVEGAGATAARIAERTGETTATEATLLGRSERATTAGAAFVNGTAAHGLDFDDGSDAFGGHPSASIVPTLLALGQGLGVDGEALLTAYVGGFEAGCYLSAAIMPGHFEAGWHPTGTMGAFAAAAGGARLLGLDRAQTCTALGVTASMASGLLANLGTMTKPMHCGHAARSGVTAALLAAEGFSSNPAAVEGDRGFLRLYGGSEVVDEPGYDLGTRWAIIEEGLDIKRYPSCYFTHPAMHLATTLVEAHDIDVDAIERIEVTIAEGGIDSLTYEDPSTPLEAKFSMPYMVASALVRDRIDFRIFRDDYLNDPEVQSLQQRVSLQLDPDLPHTSFATTVEITTKGGKTVSDSLGEHPGPPGKATNPLSEDQLREKFMMCAARAMPETEAAELHTALGELGTAASIEGVMDHLDP